MPKHRDFDTEKKQALADAVTELPQATTLYEVDAKKVLATLHGFGQKHANALPAENDNQHKAPKVFAFVGTDKKG